MNNNETSVSNWYQIKAFILKYKEVIAVFAVFTAILFTWSAIFSIVNPAAGEAFAYNLTLISGVLTLGFVGVCAAAGVGITAFFSALLLGWGIQKVAGEWRLAQLAKTVPQFDGQSDYLFIIAPGDGQEAVSRLQGIESSLPDGNIIGLLQYRQPLITVIQKKKAGVERGQIDRGDFLTAFAGCDFANETPQTFGEYASRARNEFSAYCANVRLQLPGTTLYDLANSGLRVSLTAIALLLFSLPSFAQTKTERVNMGLGAAAQTVPQKGKAVAYTFDKGTITRHADGVNTVAALVTADGRPGADSDNMGQLVGIDIAGLAIKAVPQVKQQQPEKPKPLFQTYIESSAPVLPDSATFDQKLQGAESYFDAQYTVLNQMCGKVWASRLTGTFINLVLIAFLLSVFFSNICNNEVIINRGRTYNGKLSAMAQFFMFLAFILGIIAVTPILAGAIWYVLEGYVISAFMVVVQWKVIVTVIMLLIMRSLVVKFVDWLFVAPRQNNGGFHDNGNRGGNNQRLNG